ncbi:hypothetical protein EDD16DRAFT_1665214 [Pisolithus croceorrhizus]|nr:hypothetical protein EDD16DRAFT_1665214 [Pisolithus croceorrhizus]
MGCDQAQWKEQDPKTKDEVTDAAVAKLRTAVGGSLSVDAVIAADEATISDAISKVRFWRRKTQYIKQAAQGLRDDFDSNVPKMAFPALQAAWKLQDATTFPPFPLSDGDPEGISELEWMYTFIE